LQGGLGLPDDRETAREAKAAAKVVWDAQRRSQWEVAMATAEEAHVATQAAAQAAAASQEAAAPRPASPEGSVDSDDEDPLAPFQRTPFEEWSTAQVIPASSGRG
jgi:hypothetical protein